jgi:hypothetical protein
MELTKLARVRIDMPNDLDAMWQIDVKKGSAKPPLQVRERLLNIINEIGAPSRAVYEKRGTRLHDASLPVWQRVQQDNAITYRINPENPLIAEFAESLSVELRAPFTRVVNVVGSGIPMDAIFADLAGRPEAVQGEAIADESLRHLVAITSGSLTSRGHPLGAVADLMRVVEPFRSNWDRVEPMLGLLDEAGANDGG